MKIRNLEIILNNMSPLGFWLFMRKPTRVRMAILKRKVAK